MDNPDVGWPVWAIPLAVSSGVTIAVCTWNTWITWWLDRRKRTTSELSTLLSSPNVKDVIFETPEHTERAESDNDYWNKYATDTLGPALNNIELFATLTVRGFGFSRIYSRGLVRSMGCDILTSIWFADETQDYVKGKRKQAAANKVANPDTLFGDFEKLAKWLQKHPLKR